MEKIGGLTKTEIWKINLDEVAINRYPLEVIKYLGKRKYYKSEGFWKIVAILYELDEDFINDIEEQLDSYCLDYFIMYQKLSDSFIIRNLMFVPHLHYRHWNLVSQYQDLSESFIRKAKDHLMWNLVSMHQKMSEEFMIEFIKNLEIGSFDKFYNSKGELEIFREPGLIHNQKIPEDVKKRVIDLKKVIDQ
jgi:hypothetical protein